MKTNLPRIIRGNALYSVTQLKCLVKKVNKVAGKEILRFNEPERSLINFGFNAIESFEDHNLMVTMMRDEVTVFLNNINKMAGKKVVARDRNQNIYMTGWHETGDECYEWSDERPEWDWIDDIIVKNRVNGIKNVYTWVDVKLENGRVIRVEEGICSLVKKLNDTGFTTFFSCSGMEKDHVQRYAFDLPRRPFILFKDLGKKKREMLVKICQKLDLQWKDYYDKTRFEIRFLGTYPGGDLVMYGFIPFIHYTDEIIKKRFDEFEEELDIITCKADPSCRVCTSRPC